MNINKSSRHAKITGDFGETLVLYWLSKYGFECALIDHTGIDILARNPHTDELMGISVKSRSRNEGAEEEYVNIPNDNFNKAKVACKAFGCVPYYAIVIDAGNSIRVFLLSMDHFLEVSPMRQTAAGWKMRKKAIAAYEKDEDIMIFEMKAETKRWWNS